MNYAMLDACIRLTRLYRPFGIFLVLWPALWSLWLAAEGLPDLKLIVSFILGCILMRSAGCVINDYADRNLDGHVERTRSRPLVTGAIKPAGALALFFLLCGLAFGLVLLTNRLTIQLALGGLLLAAIYPFTKRYTHLPQVFLGAAFAWAVPMAFAAQSGTVPSGAWLIYVLVVVWAVIYDTFYAIVDREDDLRIGIKSTAILFGELDRLMTGLLQLLMLSGLLLAGGRFGMSTPYYIAVAIAAGLFAWQQYLIRNRDRQACFRAFLNNNWVGLVLLAGIVAHYQLNSVA